MFMFAVLALVLSVAAACVSVADCTMQMRQASGGVWSIADLSSQQVQSGFAVTSQQPCNCGSPLM
jgi:hypothetical protein